MTMPPRTTPANTALTRHGLERRRHQFKDLHQFMVQEEQAFNMLLAQLQAFVERYIELLGCHYQELDALESQLHTATRYLAEALSRHGIEAPMPLAPQATALPVLPQLPPCAPLPPEPVDAALGEVQLSPPSLKTLYRRAAMRLHPDFAADDTERQGREQAMMAVNAAYAQGERAPLEALLLAAGEPPQRVMGGNADALQAWLSRSEHLVQGRLRVVQAYRVALQAHPMHQLWVAITRAEQKGLDPLCVMASRLRSQIQERRRELYIGQRLQAESGLAQAFLHRRVQRMGAAPRVSPAAFETPRQPA
ncbi:J domain-containing protein [Roseateles koreensis]|uniref:J domain-containing protein n=1 Tax=Roseateles koreensis TaxID=2987526 RepID=A0ABT5KWZ0_9BURK|nr:J domain-containing protein [Roseateles koreensis]MDC8786292.1 J domain-containing protein [Roseateles koreensis]